MARTKKDPSAEQLSFEKGGFDQGDVVEQAKDYIIAAAQMLLNLGGEHAKIGWLLEDSLMYLDEINQKFANEKMLYSLSSKVATSETLKEEKVAKSK